MTKQFLIEVHKVVALAVGAFITLMGVTGAGLLFKLEIDHWLHDERAVAVPHGQPAQWDAVFSAARKAVPDGRVFTMKAFEDPAQAFEVYVEADKPRRLWIDPYIGRIVTDSEDPGTPTAILFRLHTQLLAGDFGTGVVAIIGVSLVVLSITGFILWWPRSLKEGFRIRWSGKPVAVNYDVHRVWGAGFGVFLLANALTGLMLLFSTTTGNAANRIFGGSLPSTRLADSSVLPGGYRSIDSMVAAANRAFPVGVVTRVRVAWPRAAVIVQKRVPQSERHPNGLNRIYVNPYSAQVIQVIPAAEAPPAVKLFAWAYPWHTGEYFGAGQKIVWLLLALTPLLMFATGLTVWLIRRRRRQNAARKGALATATTGVQRQ